MENEKKQDEKLCPNALPVVGGLIIGVVNEQDEVTLLPQPEVIDKEFYDTVIQNTGMDVQFRFSKPCIQGKCGHWTGHSCNVPGRVMQRVEARMVAEGTLPLCEIRPSCRWYTQEGPAACHICPIVINFKREDGETLQGNGVE
jgi:hypothetical protein